MLRSFCFVCAIGLAWLAGGSPLAAEPQIDGRVPSLPVEWTEVKYGAIQAQVWFSGNLKSRKQSILSAESEGRLAAVSEIGDRFAAGQVVARLDDTLAQQSLRERQAELKAQKARIAFLDKEAKRLKKLARSNNAALNELDRTQSDLSMARSQHDGITARIQLSEEGIRRMTVLAPYDGVIYKRYKQVGEWLESGSQIVAIASTRSLEVEIRVPADYLSYIQPNDVLDARIGRKTHQLVVRTMVPVGDEISRLFDLLLQPTEDMGPINQIVYVSVPASAPRKSLLIPEDALIIRSDGISVFVVDENMTARRTMVKTGISNRNGLVEVDGDLRPGDRVVIRGGERLRDGAQVRKPATPSQSAP